MLEKVRGFVQWSELQAAAGALEKALEAVEQSPDPRAAAQSALTPYTEYLNLLERHLPLLVQEGGSQALHREPVYLYLLPSLSGDRDERWVLCQYAATSELAAGVELLKWRFGQQQASIDPLGGVHPVAGLEEPRALDRRAIRVAATEDELAESAQITLLFPAGRVVVAADRQRGILHADWREKQAALPVKKGDCRIERYSWDAMNPAVWVCQTPGEWDDVLFTPQGEPIRLPDNSRIGQVLGADAPGRDPNRIYLASSNARVLRIEIGEPTARVMRSQRLGGPVHDVLAVPHPDRDGDYAVLAAAYNSTLYLFDEDAGDPGASLTPLYQQLTDYHIVRIAGGGGEHLLAMDQHSTLLVLRLVSPLRHFELRDRATQRLHAALALPELAARIWGESAGSESDGELREPVARLALEEYLRCLKGGEQPAAGPLQELYFWLNRPYGGAEGWEVERARAVLHLRLMERIWRLLAKRSRAFGNRRGAQGHAAMALLWNLLELEPSAPDDCWLAVFRNYDWPDCWARETGAEGGPARALEALWRKVQTMRARLLPAMHDIRPLTIRSSIRFPSQSRHLRMVDEARRWVALVEYQVGLRVMRVPAEPLEPWEQIALISHEEGGWVGMPTTLYTGPRLAAAVGSAEWPYLLLGTDRGELQLLRLEGKRLRPMWRKPRQIDLRIACCELVSSGRGATVLLGGESRMGRPALWWYSLSGEGRGGALWEAEEERRGSIRMLAVDRQLRLWCIEREQGRLLHWPGLAATLARPGTRLASPQVWLDRRTRLHALALSYELTVAGRESGDGEPTVLCGGHNGLALALAAGGGRLRWVTGCGNSLRRAVHLPGAEGGWLLCGDLDHLLMVDDGGSLTGLIEGIGPVTALCRVGTDQVLVGCLDGRLALIDTGSPQPALPAAEGEVEQDPRLYPLRSNAVPAPELLQQIFEVQRPAEETLTTMAWLRHARRLLAQGEGSRQALPDLGRYLTRQSPSRVAWLLRGGHQAERPDAQELVPLIEEIWSHVEQRNPHEVLCHEINASLIVLEKAAFAPGPQQEPARSLLGRMLLCIWEEPLSPDFCPEAQLRNAERRTLLRLAQAIRFRPPPEPADEAEWWADWCKRLLTLWQGIGIRQLAWRLFRVLSTGFPWLRVGETRWCDWLRGMCALNGAGEPVVAAGEPPEPLTVLWSPQFEVAPGDEWAAVARLWPDNLPWQQWVNDLLAGLGAVAHCRDATPPVAWRERQALFAVRAHFQVEGANRFQLETGQPLLALWWPLLAARWEAAILEQLEDLDERVAASDDLYLDVAVSDRWRGGSELDLRLTITNRTPYSLRLERIQWQTVELSLPDLPCELPTQEAAVVLTVPITTAVPDRVTGELLLDCRDLHRGGHWLRRTPVDASRGLARFRPEPEWAPTWGRLERLLEGLAQHGEAFCWLEGHLWPADEHLRLRAVLAEKYGTEVASLPRLCTLGDALAEAAQPIFCPDIALGAQPRGRLLEQVHALLHEPRRPGFHWLALSFWAAARPEAWPAGLAAALAEVITGRQVLDGLLLRLLGDAGAVAAFWDELAGLPRAALGAWCHGDPLHANSHHEKNLAAPGLYESPVGLLGEPFWRFVDRAAIDPSALGELCGRSAEVARRQRHERRLLARLWDGSRAGGRHDAEVDESAQLLLGSFGAGKPARSGGLWIRHGELTLHHESYSRCILIGPGCPAAQLARPEGEAPAVWLSVQERISAPLPGRLILLTPDDCIRLVHGNGPEEAVALLNQLAAAQLPIDTRAVFRISGGMPGRIVARHFAGRAHELRTLWQAVRDADDGWGAALIVGGRRLGKTTLRQRLEYELEQEAPHRAVLHMNVEGTPPGLSGRGLEHWFLRYLYRTTLTWAARHKDRFAMAWEWNQAENPYQQARAREALRDWLERVRQATGSSVVLTLDETDQLVRRDREERADREPYGLFRLLRSLVQDSLLCLVATTYPYGAAASDSLRLLTHNGEAPLFNLFSQFVTLRPWEPATAWEFLRGKLAGLGVILPEELASEVLAASWGIPSVVHALGRALCHGEEQGRRLILRDEWGAAQFKVRKLVRFGLKKTVMEVAERVDRAFLGDAALPGQRLAPERLWSGLRQIVARGAVSVPDIGGEWPRLRFRVDELHALVGYAVAREQLTEALMRLCSTMVLEGNQVQGDEFEMANGMLIGGGDA